MKNRIILCGVLILVGVSQISCMVRLKELSSGVDVLGFGPQTIVTGSDVIAEKTVEGIGEFNSVVVSSGGVDVKYEYGEPKAVLHGPENLLEYIVVTQDGGQLNVAVKKGIWFRNLTKDFYLSLSSKSLEKVTISGSSDFEAVGDIDEDVMKMSISGSGNIGFDSVKAAEVVAEIIGSGDVDVDSLESDALSLSVSGSGDISADWVKSRSVDIRISGSGDVDIKSAELGLLNGTIMGSGDIAVSGRADKVAFSTTGSGDVSVSGYADQASFSVTGSGDVNVNRLKCPDLKVKGNK